MKIKQIRNATLRVNFGGVEFLIDRGSSARLKDSLSVKGRSLRRLSIPRNWTS